MKRINIVGFINFHREDWDIRPSMVEKTRQALYDSEVWTYKDLCALTEKQLLKIRHVTPELVEHIKETLESAGLHLGMTEKELDAYHDAEYDERHSSVESKGTSEEEIAKDEAKEDAVFADTDAIQKKWNELLLETEQEKDTEQKKGTEQLPETELLQETEPLQETEAKHKKEFDAQKAYNHAMARILRDPCQMLRGDDLEFMRHQLVMSVLEQQSWLMRTFCSFNYRVKVAMRKANYIMQEYRHDMGLRSTVYQHLEYDGTIKELEA